MPRRWRSWLGPVHGDLTAMTRDLPLKARKVDAGGKVIQEGTFRAALMNAGLGRLQDALPDLHVNRSARVAVQFGWAELFNCDEAAHSLDVRYHVYSINLSPTFAHLFHNVESLGRSPVKNRLT